jgi:hypothetical protein
MELTNNFHQEVKMGKIFQLVILILMLSPFLRKDEFLHK